MGNAKVQDLSYYYKQDEGSGILSKTFQSSEQLTPLQIPHRHTVSQDRYRQYWENAPKVPRCLWGRDREYAGIGPISLPEVHRPKMEPPPKVMKGHRHHGYGGYVWPTSVTIPQYYDLTMIKKSNVRTNDQLEKQIRLRFPAEHPYQSHISRFAVFPNFKSPDDPDTGVRARNIQPIQPFTPAKAPDVIVLSKTRGSGPMNPVQLDDYHEKIIADVTGEINPYTAELGHRRLEPHPTENTKGVCVNEARSQSCEPEGQYIALDMKQPTERPRSVGFERTEEEVQPPRPDVCYEDPPSSGKEHYTVGPNPFSLRQPYLWSSFKNPSDWKEPISEALLQDAVYPSTFHLTECEQRPTSVRLHAAIKGSGSEVPRPQSAILKLQDSFTKSGAHRRFHEAIKGEMMDLRENIHTGRRHQFFGFNSYYYR
ncbi:hypothetical protein EOD39_2917 [Acipenser ruthenus]|uniref:Uncharacterized protein n=1 Tax=Acipenser ruthenus TaxID=7906 RepID=A0A444TXH4_ACIRT|nr:hypothetical protein EOD39_2917 [Acipenser ruthenus]